MNNDLISRSMVLQAIDRNISNMRKVANGDRMANKAIDLVQITRDFIANHPAATAERTGRWIKRLDGDGEFVHHMCSECKADAIFQYNIEDDYDEGMDGAWYCIGKITTGIEEHLTNCCPNCGVKMEQEAAREV